jgi:hypothetical protein
MIGLPANRWNSTVARSRLAVRFLGCAGVLVTRTTAVPGVRGATTVCDGRALLARGLSSSSPLRGSSLSSSSSWRDGTRSGVRVPRSRVSMSDSFRSHRRNGFSSGELIIVLRRYPLPFSTAGRLRDRVSIVGSVDSVAKSRIIKSVRSAGILRSSPPPLSAPGCLWRRGHTSSNVNDFAFQVPKKRGNLKGQPSTKREVFVSIWCVQNMSPSLFAICEIRALPHVVLAVECSRPQVTETASCNVVLKDAVEDASKFTPGRKRFECPE